MQVDDLHPRKPSQAQASWLDKNLINERPPADRAQQYKLWWLQSFCVRTNRHSSWFTSAPLQSVARACQRIQRRNIRHCGCPYLAHLSLCQISACKWQTHQTMQQQGTPLHGGWVWLPTPRAEALPSKARSKTSWAGVRTVRARGTWSPGLPPQQDLGKESLCRSTESRGRRQPQPHREQETTRKWDRPGSISQA